MKWCKLIFELLAPSLLESESISLNWFVSAHRFVGAKTVIALSNSISVYMHIL